MAGKIGKVKAVQLESKGSGPYKGGKVRVNLDLSAPLWNYSEFRRQEDLGGF